MNNTRAIIFDLGAVLLNINYHKTIEEFEKLGIKNSTSFYSKKEQTDLFNLLETGKISEEDFITEVKKKCKYGSDNKIISAWNAMLLDLPKHRVSLLKDLNKKYDIYLLSNTNSIHITELKNIMGYEKYEVFYNLFKKVYYSHEIGFRKPNKESFQLILGENNLDPDDVLFIDDSPQHIEGAKNLGIRAYHLKDGEEVTTLFPDIAL